MNKLERATYEWWKPELQGKDWHISVLHGSPRALVARSKNGDAIMGLPPIHCLNGRPNWPFWMDECVPRLEAERVDVSFIGGKWFLVPGALGPASQGTDPLVALGEYLGVSSAKD